MKPGTLAAWLYLAVLLDGFTTFIGLTYYPQIWEGNAPFKHVQPAVLLQLKFILATVSTFTLAWAYNTTKATKLGIWVEAFLTGSPLVFSMVPLQNIFQIAYWSTH